MLKPNFKAETKNLFFLLGRNIFLSLFVLLIIFSVAELIKPRIIISYINTNIFIGSVLFFGLITMLYFQQNKQAMKKMNFLEQMTMILLSVLIGIFILFLTKSIGLLSILTGFAGTIIAYYLINLIYQND
ncbi:MAG: hypothetical protein A2Y82_01720 [Candidatus Buchananbacteria bacterium RBG_13_36_9]|uniref:Uncharacterized protein n=1 Tax=Candidatus Buchananbacteria bacterium RBG_13_36_9 TaxID=1797530 RepID=A0A1G1XR63_9BACT|nr:MAG: hypothetical protein A2Y82_01720 [Candidatus Buchananbacteria bacterium RBG_13_36_9]